MTDELSRIMALEREVKSLRATLGCWMLASSMLRHTANVNEDEALERAKVGK